MVMTDKQQFREFELEILDDLANEEGVSPLLVRALLNEQVRTRADGRAGLRAAVESLIDEAAHDLLSEDRCESNA